MLDENQIILPPPGDYKLWGIQPTGAVWIVMKKSGYLDSKFSIAWSTKLKVKVFCQQEQNDVECEDRLLVYIRHKKTFTSVLQNNVES